MSVFQDKVTVLWDDVSRLLRLYIFVKLVTT